MEKLLLEIITNTPFIEIKTDKIIEVANAILEETGQELKFKQAVIYYKHNGWDRQRKLRNTYTVWIINNHLN